MARVYISSSYIDLKEERRVIADALHARGHVAVGMESYHASDSPPLEFCIRDVESCDAYIGLFAFRYGSIARGQGKCITEMEYEAATKNGIPRLIFLLRDDAPWPADRIDRDRTHIDGLRERLRNAHLVKHFATAVELAAHVRDAIDIEIGAGRAIPGDLPWLCDRGPQEEHLIARYADVGQRGKPMVVLVAGDTRQAHDMYAQRLEVNILPELLGSPGHRAGVTAYHVPWPTGIASGEELRRVYMRRLGEAALKKKNPAEGEIQQHLLQHPAPVMIYSYYLVENWDKKSEECINSFVDLWTTWRGAIGQEVLAFLFLKHERKSRGLMSLLRFRDAAQQISELLKRHQQCVVLPPLHDVPQQEALDWAAREDVCEYRSPAELTEEIAAFYGEWRKRHSESAVPMQDLAKKLLNLLQRGAGEMRAA